MRKSIALILLICSIGLTTTAQPGNFYDTNNQVLLQNRYDKVDGSPYLLSDWTKGTLYPIKGEPIKQDKINFNGDTGKFDIVEASTQIELNAALYSRIVLQADNQQLQFVNRLRADDLTYYRVLHEGNDYLFLEKFESDLKSVGASYGVSADKEKFVTRTQNFIWQNGQLHDINRNTKKIIDFFGSAALKKQTKSKKWNLKKDEDLTAALDYYDQRQEKKK